MGMHDAGSENRFSTYRKASVSFFEMRACLVAYTGCYRRAMTGAALTAEVYSGRWQ